MYQEQEKIFFNENKKDAIIVIESKMARVEKYMDELKTHSAPTVGGGWNSSNGAGYDKGQKVARETGINHRGVQGSKTKQLKG